MSENKKCPKCKKTIKLTKFGKNKRTKNGFSCYCKKCNNELRKIYYRKNPNSVYDSNLKRLYGINHDNYLELLEKQDHRCAICNLTLEETPHNNKFRNNKHFHLDHDHKTGKLRGLLCNACNTGIGYFQENQLLLESAISYLKKYRKESID